MSEESKKELDQNKDELSKKNLDIQVDDEWRLTQESALQVIKNGGFEMQSQFLNHLKDKLKNEYNSPIVADRLDKFNSCLVYDNENSGALALCDPNSNSVMLGYSLFNGIRLHKNKDGKFCLVPIVKTEEFGEFIDSINHELNHAAAFDEEPIYNRHGKEISKDYFFGINKRYQYCQTMEGINQVISSMQTAFNTASYFEAQLATFALVNLFGIDELERITTEDPQKTHEILNKFTNHKDYLGRMETLVYISDYIMENMMSIEGDESKKEVYDEYLKYYKDTLSVINGFTLFDIIIPKMAEKKSDIAKYDYVKSFVKQEYVFQAQLLNLYYDTVLSVGNENGVQFRDRIYSRYENLIDMFSDAFINIPGNPTVFQRLGCHSAPIILSKEMSRELIGIQTYKSMELETQKAYESYVKALCENLNGKMKIATKMIKSENRMALGRFVPDEEGMQNISSFEYVAEKNGYSIDNLKFHSNDYTTFDISKKPILSDEEINRNFSSFNKYFAESWKMYDEGTKYADDLVDELY